MRTATLLPLLFLLPATASAQQASGPMSPAATIASATAPLPEEFREGATVLAHGPDGVGLSVLRAGSGPFICLADQPADDRFHVACYHRSLEPFMARGREIRARGLEAEVDSIRFAEIEAGRLPLPTQPAALYSLTGPPGSVDRATGTVAGAQPLFVVYIPFATAESTGLPATPVRDAPWIMFPGTPKAHIMFVPEMR